MIKLLSAKDAAAITRKARAKISITQHELAHKKIQEAAEKGYNAIILNYTEFQYAYEIIHAELTQLGYIVERKQPINANYNIQLAQEIHISW